MFSQTVEYALRAVVHLANCAPNACTTEDVAKSTKVPQAYLAKVLQSLVQAGVLRSQRGIHGGVALAVKPSELTILEVVNAVDPIKRIKTCPLGLEAHGVNLCPLHRRVDEALASVEQAFGSSTLQEILDEPTTSVPLCNFPPRVALGRKR
jgi:Rrf2 family protein